MAEWDIKNNPLALEIIKTIRDKEIIDEHIKQGYLLLIKSESTAYIIPKNLFVGQKVFVEDLIEGHIGDIVKTTNGSEKKIEFIRLKCTQAIWNGKDLEMIILPPKELNIHIDNFPEIIDTDKYFVLVEAERTAFITDYSDYESTRVLANKLISLANMFCSVDELEKIVSILERKNYTSFKMDGTNIHFENSETSISNGIYSVSIVRVDEEFCLKSFIKERQNHSELFTVDKITHGYVDLDFPPYNRIAN